jgi:hypothetical protein
MTKIVKQTIGKCIPEYSSRYESQAPFGKALTYPDMLSNDTTYTAFLYIF